MLGPKLKSHPGTEEVGTVWGFGDLSGEIHTHWSVSFLSDWEDMGDRLVGIWVKGSSNRYLCTDMGSLKVSPNYQNPWGKVRSGIVFQSARNGYFRQDGGVRFCMNAKALI